MKTIIEMARETGLPEAWISETGVLKWSDLERFAELVTEQANARATSSWTLMCKKMVAFEREACANACEDEICNCCWDEQAGAVAEHLAATIRARGNT